MQTIILSPEEIISGYDKVSILYPFIPSLSHWRSWEYAAYQKYDLSGRILDIGCGDGAYFRLLWPHATHVVGIDINEEVAELARNSGVYKQVHTTAAHHIPEENETFDHVFANCSLEHMDYIDDVLAELFRCLKPEGTLLCSVVTNRFIEWCLLPDFLEKASFSDAARSIRDRFVDFHHVVNPFTVNTWREKFTNNGFSIQEHVPILPRFNSSLFLFIDNIWHTRENSGGEIGDIIYPFLSTNPKFPDAFRKIIEAFLELETDRQDCSGSVFLLKKFS
ncbi:class I SAM-dependent methyltransferase [Legionella parisiensis]|uniref:Ubiquinone/menaquinone biosynthesis C-methyltransferase UbiE n=1 Tax=Legionella parisiensis TaxID=45071 RepID=A0A1E5JL56_9GAMM|nr:class I SAM-dependent methyltransferase [Legionella parisiensis]KTD41677.1 Methyltransferase [Legionella parisiensis]OEH45275.1 Ubiquinone/menaquinone biosynthesis C-methyltransferase UbiE [Legionella parisiensis]STX76001.1 Methyltransferase [Legionella parisiensis]